MVKDLLVVENAAWPEGLRASEVQLQSRVDVFPEGVITIDQEGRVFAFSTSMRFDYNPHLPPRSWEEVTGYGNIERVHDPEGDSLYVISVAVHPSYQGRHYGDILLDEQKALGEKLGLRYVVLGCRVPSAHLYPDAPIEAVVAGDPQVLFYKKNGFKQVAIQPDYMEDDAESLNFGVVLDYKI